jgi:hypothetical protein
MSWIDDTPFGKLLDRSFDSLENLFSLGENKRARNADGTFIADDPNTPENEAWTKGKAPKKTKTKKKTSKKSKGVF